MEHREGTGAWLPDSATALTVGVFDGVHLGHRHLIGGLVARARAIGALAGVITFDPHPKAVLSPGGESTYLTNLAERHRLLAGLGLDLIATLGFNRALSQMEAADFTALLRQLFRMRELWVGPDFALGHRRRGTVEVLREIGLRQGFRVEVVPPLTAGGQVVSSSAIRRLLGEGQVAEAARLLGRPYGLTAEVNTGAGRGRALGFPTANLAPEPARLLPANGVYAVHAYCDAGRYLGVANIGVRPTFGEVQRTLEVHLLDFDGHLYGQRLTVEFLKRLRDERRFPSVEELKAQIRRDIEEALAIGDRVAWT